MRQRAEMEHAPVKKPARTVQMIVGRAVVWMDVRSTIFQVVQDAHVRNASARKTPSAVMFSGTTFV